MRRNNRQIKRLFAAAAIIIASAALRADAADFAFVTVTDYETGSAAAIWLDGSYTTETDVASIHSDAVARWYGGLVYVVNRQNGDNIQVLDPSAGFATLRQYSTGNGTNPVDIAFRTETKAYVTLYDSNELLIMNTLTGEHLGTIDLSGFADGDGLCEMNYMYIIHDMLYVEIQRLDRNYYWGPAGGSCIAVIDCAADTVVDTDGGTPGVQGIALTGENPFSELGYDGSSGKLFVSCVGWWGIQDGGVVIVDPESLVSEGYMITEAAAGGDINDAELHGPSKGYAIVTDASFHTELISFDPSTGTKGSTVYAPGAYVINDIEISPDGELFLADQTPVAPGIRIYDTSTDSEITTDPISTGLPPFDICFSVPDLSGSEAPAAAALMQNYPNPFNPVTVIPFSIEKAGHVRIEIYDAAGRRIGTLADESFPAGRHEVVWNGRGGSGALSASGVYFIRMAAGSASGSIKTVLLR